MSNVAIAVEGLGKHYRIGTGPTEPYGSLRESLMRSVQAPLRRLRQARQAGAAASDHWALQDVSFEVKHGEAVGIIGRNGAGKSTLLKVLSRITEPTTGRAIVHGRVGSLLEVGTGFHPELTGRENIYLNGAVMGMSRADIKRHFDEIVDFSGVEKYLDTPVKRYSSGMYMRLAFAVAAHLEPEVLVVDEVLAVGDLEFQRKCLSKMNAVAHEGRTVLFVSHNMAAIRRLCKYCILLDHGNVSMHDETSVVLQRYIDSRETMQPSYELPAPDDPDTPGYAYRLVVEDDMGRPSTSIPVGKTWQVRVFLTIKERLEHVTIALGLQTNDTFLRTSWSRPQVMEPGHYNVLFKEDCVVLGTGSYQLAVGLATHETRTFYYTEQAGFLEIADFSERDGIVRTSGHGAILNPLITRISKDSVPWEAA